MKHLLFIALLFITTPRAHAQNIYIDVQCNWYAQPPRMELDQLDTIVLVKEKPADDPAKPLLLWQYAGNEKYQPLLVYNPTPGMQFIYSIERWKIEQIAPTQYKLSMREGEKLLSGKQRKYNMVLFRDDHLILQKIILVRRP
jgi:hypothetical protein